STFADGGPRWSFAIIASTAASSPSTCASTRPSGQLRTQPLTPITSASSRTQSRKNTPCTRPVTLAWRATGISHRRDLRRVLGLHANDIVAGVDVVNFPGDAGREIAQQVQSRPADILDRDVAPQRRIIFIPLHAVAEFT